jgi:hypothetical protein
MLVRREGSLLDIQLRFVPWPSARTGSAPSPAPMTRRVGCAIWRAVLRSERQFTEKKLNLTNLQSASCPGRKVARSSDVTSSVNSIFMFKLLLL